MFCRYRDVVLRLNELADRESKQYRVMCAPIMREAAEDILRLREDVKALTENVKALEAKDTLRCATLRMERDHARMTLHRIKHNAADFEDALSMIKEAHKDV